MRFDYKELNEQIEKRVGATFCSETIKEIIVETHEVKTFNEFHGFHRVESAVCEFLRILLDKYGFVNGDPGKNSLDNNPKAFFVWEMYRCIGNAYNIYPMVHHGTDTQAKEAVLNLFYSIHNQINSIQTPYDKRMKRFVDLSPFGTRLQILLNSRTGTVYTPKHVFK